MLKNQIVYFVEDSCGVRMKFLSDCVHMNVSTDMPKMLCTVVLGEQKMENYKGMRSENTVEPLVKQPHVRACSNSDGLWPCISLAWLNICTAVSGLEHINAGRPPH